MNPYAEMNLINQNSWLEVIETQFKLAEARKKLIYWLI